MIYIHHHHDSECEEPPPRRIQRIAEHLRWTTGKAFANVRTFVSANNASFENLTEDAALCGADYWEIIIEDTDL